MKTRYKIALGSVALGTVVFLGGTAYVVSDLPSPRAISRTLDNIPLKTPTETKVTEDAVPTGAQAETADETAPKNTDLKTLREGLVQLTVADPADIRVCENLGRSKMFDGKSGKEADVDFDAFLKPEGRQDSVAESFRPVVVTMFRDEQFSELMADISSKSNLETAGKEEAESFLDKIDFYARAASTVAHMYGRKAEFEALGDRANHLSVLAKLAVLKPELVGTQELMDACERIQSSMSNQEPVDVKAERKEILALIAQHGVKPAQLDFEPDQFMKFKASFKENSLSFTISDKEDGPARL